MPQPRKVLISLEDTPYYHIVSRCVRRTFLCGDDKTRGQSYEHRRQWIENRIRLLSSIFTIDICSYAVMSNHYHLVVKLSPEEANNWTEQEVVDRWLSIYKGSYLVQKWNKKEQQTEAELQTTKETINQYKNRLTSLSWFMKCLNEPIARQANKEDNCTGHFWESRFKSQALLKEDAILSAMTYVDLNPIRAAKAESPETSDHTSIKERIEQTFSLQDAITQQQTQETLYDFKLPLKPLKVFEGNLKAEEQVGILFSFEEYLNLVDTTGRIIREDKRGAIKQNLPPILERLNIEHEQWLENTTQFEVVYQRRFARKRKSRIKRLAETG